MSKLSVKILLSLNRLFKKPIHPFNLQNDGVKSYGQWQYEKGEQTVKFYLEKYTAEDLFMGKRLLDIGCGAGGKSMYYASQGAFVTGMDIVESYAKESSELANILGITPDRFSFVLGDASSLPFENGTFDCVVMNDAVEHVADPAAVISEALRVLKPGGRLFMNFPPYFHPYGAHLSDAIGMPWVQLFFTEKTLITAYKQLVADLPDGRERIDFRISSDENGKEYFSYINRITLKRFKKTLKKLGIKPEYYKEIPLRGFLKPFAKIPFIKELFVKMAVCVVKVDQ